MLFPYIFILQRSIAHWLFLHAHPNLGGQSSSAMVHIYSGALVMHVEVCRCVSLIYNKTALQGISNLHLLLSAAPPFPSCIQRASPPPPPAAACLSWAVVCSFSTLMKSERIFHQIVEAH